MYNIQSEKNYVILSSIIQLVNYMFRPLYLAIIRLYLVTEDCITQPVYLMGDEISLTMVGYMNSINRMIPIFAIYILCTTF